MPWWISSSTWVRRAVSAGAGVLSGVAALLFWVVSPIYFAFFLMADTSKIDKLERHIPFLKAETSKDVVYLFQEFLNIIVAFFRGQLIIAFLQGLLFAIGFTLVGLKYGFVIGLTLGLPQHRALPGQHPRSRHRAAVGVLPGRRRHDARPRSCSSCSPACNRSRATS